MINRKNMRYFLIFVVSCFMHIETRAQNCESMKVEINLVHSSQSNNGLGIAVINKASEPNIERQYFFFNQEGNSLSRYMSPGNNSAYNLKPGKYFCIVKEGECTKRIDFEIL